jgi:hypothetical protein
MSVENTMTDDELVAYLKRSELPVVLVEGRDDMTVYRWIEENLEDGLGVVVPCGGRTKLANIVARRNEFLGCSVVFLADRDCDVLEGEAADSPNLIWTDGYSIENDLLTTGSIDKLLTKSEKFTLNKIAHSLVLWFTRAVIHHKEGGELKLNRHTNSLIDHKTMELIEDHGLSPDLLDKYSRVINLIQEQPRKCVRGKNLFDAFVIILSHTKRSSKYSRLNLYELCATNYNNSEILRTRLDRIAMSLGTESCPQR